MQDKCLLHHPEEGPTVSVQPFCRTSCSENVHTTSLFSFPPFVVAVEQRRKLEEPSLESMGGSKASPPQGMHVIIGLA